MLVRNLETNGRGKEVENSKTERSTMRKLVLVDWKQPLFPRNQVLYRVVPEKDRLGGEVTLVMAMIVRKRKKCETCSNVDLVRWLLPVRNHLLLLPLLRHLPSRDLDLVRILRKSKGPLVRASLLSIPQYTMLIDECHLISQTSASTPMLKSRTRDR